MALGTFDGLHKGHMKVIASALGEKESGLSPLALLFDVHPQSLFGSAPPELLQPSERRAVLEELGMSIEEIGFESIYRMTPEEFFRKILIEKLNAGAVCCGENYRFGAGGAGTTSELKALCEQYKVNLIVSESALSGGELISSTRIRNLITDGKIKEANELLGREFFYRLTVVHGDARGRLIGAPTINQIFEPGFIVPAFGVYAARVEVGGITFPGVTNIGIRPTFGGGEMRSETHIIGFSGDLYGENIKVSLIDRLRSECRFNSAEELSRRISEDMENAVSVYERS